MTGKRKEVGKAGYAYSFMGAEEYESILAFHERGIVPSIPSLAKANWRRSAGRFEARNGALFYANTKVNPSHVSVRVYLS